MIVEIDFVLLHKDAAKLLFQVISDCYEHKSLIITFNSRVLSVEHRLWRQ